MSGLKFFLGLRLGCGCCSGQLQLDCTPAATGNSTQCYVAGQNTLQTCDAQPSADPIKLPILMVRCSVL